MATGGVGTRPWRLSDVEAALRGKKRDDTVCRDASFLATAGAHPARQNGFKQILLQRAVFRALQTVSA
jgi:xanthine dehydrogenase YagS FAD-binding subunit